MKRSLGWVVGLMLVASGAWADPPPGVDVASYKVNRRLRQERERADGLESELAAARVRLADAEARHQALSDEAARLRAQVAQSSTDLTQTQSALKQTQGKVERSQADLEEMQRRLEEIKRAQEAAEKRVAQFRALALRLRSMVEAGTLRVEVRNGLMIVKLPDDILFSAGKASVKTAGRAALRELTTVLREIPDRKFQVAGHTDNIPIKSRRFKSNWELSTQRAVEVVRVMVDEGMPPTRLSAAGYAEQLPVESNATSGGRALNRRIEIVVQPNLEELPSIDFQKGGEP